LPEKFPDRLYSVCVPASPHAIKPVGGFMATLGKLLLAAITFLACFYSTTLMMSHLYAMDAAPLAF
jgi:hypothetical protein